MELPTLQPPYASFAEAVCCCHTLKPECSSASLPSEGVD